MNRPVFKLPAPEEDPKPMNHPSSPAEAASPSPKTAPETIGSPLLDVEDWDRLFHAVQCRLSMAVAAVPQKPEKTRATVLECVDALDQLHRALVLGRRQRSPTP